MSNIAVNGNIAP